VLVTCDININMKDSKPLPLADTLRDLALLRASDIDLTPQLSNSRGEEPAPNPPKSDNNDNDNDAAVDDSVASSYNFVTEARNAVRMHYRGDVDTVGKAVDDIRSKIEDAVRGLSHEE
jgi:hypothetical protein